MYPIPIRAVRSHALLSPEGVAALFGEGYVLRGGERVEVAALGRTPASVEAFAGKVICLKLDRLDRASLPPSAPLHLVGPKGVLRGANASALQTTLVLPAGLRAAWGLETGQTVALAFGRLALAGVPVVEGEPVHVQADRAVLLAAEVAPDEAAYWLPDFALPTPDAPSTPSASAPAAPSGRLITENDVRQARRRHETIRPAPGQLVTPAARSLGRELGVLDAGDQGDQGDQGAADPATS